MDNSLHPSLRGSYLSFSPHSYSHSSCLTLFLSILSPPLSLLRYLSFNRSGDSTFFWHAEIYCLLLGAFGVQSVRSCLNCFNNFFPVMNSDPDSLHTHTFKETSTHI